MIGKTWLLIKIAIVLMIVDWLFHISDMLSSKFYQYLFQLYGWMMPP